MARTVQDAALDTPTARRRLEARGKPHYRAIDPGLHLGYRRVKGRKGKASAGKWVARVYVGERAYVVETIGTADDVSDANGNDVLNFSQAQAKTRKLRDDRSSAGTGATLTVEAAIKEYLKGKLEAKGKDSKDTAFRANAMIIPQLGKIKVADLKTEKIREWLTALADKPPRLRTAKGEAQRYRKIADDEEAVRRRRSTANRLLAILKAALTHAFREKRVSSDEAWRRVEPFQNVTAARLRYLTIAEAQRLINACKPDFRKLVHVALLTGCRYGELCRFKVSDFNPHSGTLSVLRSKSGKARHVVLTEEGIEFVKQLVAGLRGGDLLLQKANGSEWGKSHQIPEMVAASNAAKLSTPANFHALRHTYASLSVMAGVPLMVLARNLGHSDTRMVEKHYGHLAESYVADAIRAGAPRFGMVEKSNVHSL